MPLTVGYYWISTFESPGRAFEIEDFTVVEESVGDRRG
jgi:hypothetical protein